MLLQNRPILPRLFLGDFQPAKLSTSSPCKSHGLHLRFANDAYRALIDAIPDKVQGTERYLIL